MRFKNKTILLISPEPWGQNFVSKHHYTVALAKQGNIVYFLNPPSSSYYVQPTQYENLYVINYSPFMKGLRYLPEALQRKVIRQKYEKLQQLIQCTFDVVWSFDNSVFYDFEALPAYLLKISHIVDLNQDFQTAKAAQTADVCLCTTDFIQKKLLIHNQNTHKIHHGYNPPIETGQHSVSLPGNNLVKAAYVGNLALKYIDWKLIQTVVSQHPAIDFIFIGPENNSNLSRNREEESGSALIKTYANVYFIGAVSSTKVDIHLKNIDVLLIAYQADLHREQLASPHKFMDYFGSGKVTVATYTDEYKDKRELLAMSEKNEDYPALFSEVVNNLKRWNSLAKQEQRKQFAIDNMYSKHINRIENITKNLCVQKVQSQL